MYVTAVKRDLSGDVSYIIEYSVTLQICVVLTRTSKNDCHFCAMALLSTQGGAAAENPPVLVGVRDRQIAYDKSTTGCARAQPTRCTMPFAQLTTGAQLHYEDTGGDKTPLLVI
ncbi:MAG TPA: hypothetical protein PKX07_14540, partial [Aggregatilineales bacterium]|nr:hypothetical protein [Aggregatilineales bacterium]